MFAGWQQVDGDQTEIARQRHRRKRIGEDARQAIGEGDHAALIAAARIGVRFAE